MVQGDGLTRGRVLTRYELVRNGFLQKGHDKQERLFEQLEEDRMLGAIAKAVDVAVDGDLLTVL
jgi:hypothetical protein